MPEAPQGTISFFFTDIVGSTRLWEKHPNHMGAALARHNDIIRGIAESGGGYVFKTVGDSFCVAFPTPRLALEAAVAAQVALLDEDWSSVGTLLVRMAVHTGTAEWRDGDYFGGTLNRTSRIEAAAHGGQILVSQVTVDLLEDENLDVSFRPLGSHRLRNLDRPENLYQVIGNNLPDSFPPPKSMEVLPNNLPVQTTSFIGREKEMEEIHSLLGRTSLLTLTGTGGTGKTRLSIEVGASLIHEFRDGVWLAEFAQISDPARIVEVVATSLGVREDPERTQRESLIQFLRGKTLLLILDNCEHVLAEAAKLAAELLSSAPNLKIIATSRHSLGIRGEQTFAVPPLGMFDVRLHELTGADVVERLSQYDAVKLFIERAMAVKPDFRVTNENAPALAEVCSRLDGIPLAIELAAARVRVLDLAQIASRLNDRFRLLRGGSRTGLPHQQTLQALIDWSHDLLSEEERIVFRRMGAFLLGRSLRALEQVCSGDGVEEYDILDLLQQLVDKSLVMVERDVAGELRYTMIESVWQYAKEKLKESGEEVAVKNRHLKFFLEYAEELHPKLEGPEQKHWLDAGQADAWNFRAAMRWAVESKQCEPGFRMMAALYRLVEVRGDVREVYELLLKLLAVDGDGDGKKYRADAEVAAGRLAWALDRYGESRKHYAAARQIYETLGDENGIGVVEMLSGFINRGDQHLQEAEANFRLALELGQKTGNLYVIAAAQSGLGSIALDRGQLEEARKLKEESLTNYEELGDQWIVGLILWGVAWVARAQGDYTRAKQVLDRWVANVRELGNQWTLPYILEEYAQVAARTGKPLLAARIIGAADAQREHFSSSFSASEAEGHAELVAFILAEISDEEWNAAREEGRLATPWEVLREIDEQLS